MVGILGRLGKHGRTTLYIEDVRTFYLDEDLPHAYQRREAPVSLLGFFIPYSSNLGGLSRPFAVFCGAGWDRLHTHNH